MSEGARSLGPEGQGSLSLSLSLTGQNLIQHAPKFPGFELECMRNSVKENEFLCERWCMTLQDGMVFLLLNAAVTGVLLLNSALTGIVLLKSSPCTADALDLPFQLICGGSDFNLFVSKFLLFGQRVTWRKTWGKNVFCLCKFMFFQHKFTTVCAIRNDDNNNHNNNYVKVLKRTSSSEFLGHLEAYYCSI